MVCLRSHVPVSTKHVCNAVAYRRRAEELNEE